MSTIVLYVNLVCYLIQSKKDVSAQIMNVLFHKVRLVFLILDVCKLQMMGHLNVRHATTRLILQKIQKHSFVSVNNIMS